MVRFEWLFLIQIVMGILMIILLRKLTQMKKQMDKITQEVSNYITYVTEDIEDLEESKEVVTEEGSADIKKSINKKDEAEAKSRLIQAVLKEYFP